MTTKKTETKPTSEQARNMLTLAKDRKLAAAERGDASAVEAAEANERAWTLILQAAGKREEIEAAERAAAQCAALRPEAEQAIKDAHFATVCAAELADYERHIEGLVDVHRRLARKVPALNAASAKATDLCRRAKVAFEPAPDFVAAPYLIRDQWLGPIANNLIAAAKLGPEPYMPKMHVHAVAHTQFATPTVEGVRAQQLQNQINVNANGNGNGARP